MYPSIGARVCTETRNLLREISVSFGKFREISVKFLTETFREISVQTLIGALFFEVVWFIFKVSSLCIYFSLLIPYSSFPWVSYSWVLIHVFRSGAPLWIALSVCMSVCLYVCLYVCMYVTLFLKPLCSTTYTFSRYTWKI